MKLWTKSFYPGPTALLRPPAALALLVNPGPVYAKRRPPRRLHAERRQFHRFCLRPHVSPQQADASRCLRSTNTPGCWAFGLGRTRIFKISFDMELFSADGTFTRISPKESQEYHASPHEIQCHQLAELLGGNVLIWEGPATTSSNKTTYPQHVCPAWRIRRYDPSPKADKFGMESARSRDYNDVSSQILICYISVAAGQQGPGIQACPNVPGLVTSNSLLIPTILTTDSLIFPARPVLCQIDRCVWAPTSRALAWFRPAPRSAGADSQSGDWPAELQMASSFRRIGVQDLEELDRQGASGIITATTKTHDLWNHRCRSCARHLRAKKFQKGNALYTLSVKYAF